MSDYSELKILLDACREGKCANSREFSKAVGELFDVCSIETIAGLVADNERLEGEVQRITEARRVEWNNAQQVQVERDNLTMRVKELDLLFGRYILAMRSALIEEEHGRGPVAALEWIYNSLAGPGELAPEGETDAQAYFDREIVAVDRGMAEVMAFHAARRAGQAVKP